MNREHIEAKAKEFYKKEQLFYEDSAEFIKELASFALSIQPEGVMVKETDADKLNVGDEIWLDMNNYSRFERILNKYNNGYSIIYEFKKTGTYTIWKGYYHVKMLVKINLK